MNPSDMVFNTIYKGAIKKGSTEKQAKDQAIDGVLMYKKGQFKKVINLIEDKIRLAKALSDKSRAKC